MASRVRLSSKYSKVVEIGDAAKTNLNRLRREEIIRNLPDNLPEDIFYPKHSNEGTNFCVICGKQGEYRLSTHLDREHKELVTKNSMDYKIVMQLGRGMVQFIGRAKIHLSDVRRPITAGEWNIYHDFIQQLRKCGIPTDGGHEDTRIDRYRYVRRDEMEMMVDEAVHAMRRARSVDVEGAQAIVETETSSSAQRQQHLYESEGSVHVQQLQFEDNVHPIESIDTPPFALIKQKVKRGEPSVTLTSSQPRTDVTLMPDTSQVRKNSVSSEEESLESVPEPPGLPPTFRAPLVQRHLLYESFGDELYTGGSHVADIFKKKPKLKYMFCHKYDAFNSKYYIQEYNLPQKNEQAVKLDNNLKFWRKAVRKSHPLLLQYEQHIRQLLPDIPKRTWKPAKPAREGIYNYVSYIERFMLVAMRSRQRMGQTITVDDAIYANGIILPYMARLKEEGVKFHVRRAILRALTSFENFLSLGLEKRAGRPRRQDLEDFHRSIHHQSVLFKVEEKQATLKGIVPQEKQQEEILYCVTRADVDHEGVDTAVENLMDKFEREGMLTPSEYNYMMGALWSYVVHCNTSRNEVIYKMMYGSVIAYEEKKKATSEFAQADLTGLKSIVVKWKGGEKEQLWIGSYPYPKTRTCQKTAHGGQYFVLDRKSKKWIDYYLKLRDFVIQQNNVPDMKKPDSPFFIQYKGEPVQYYNVQRIMKQFLRDSGYAELNISCNVTRHAIASEQYCDYFRKKFENFGGADEDMTLLAAHSKRTQLTTYQDSYMNSCAYGYVKVREVAQRQEADNQDLIRRVREKFKLANLETRRKEAVPAGLFADVPESEDFDDDVSLPSNREEDPTTIVLEEQPGPSNRTDSTRRRSGSPLAVEGSPKKRPKKSNVKKDSGGKKPDAPSKEFEKVPRIVIDSSDESSQL